MPHSEPLEAHARTKLKKISELLPKNPNLSPLFIELWLKAQKLHPNHHVELHLKTPKFDLSAEDQGTDMYVVLDNTIDKMVALLNKHKDIALDKSHKPETAKREFGSDQYTPDNAPELTQEEIHEFDEDQEYVAMEDLERTKEEEQKTFAKDEDIF